MIEESTDQQLQDEARKIEDKRRRQLRYIIGAGVVGLLVIICLVVMMLSKSAKLDEVMERNEQLALENEMIQSANEFQQLDAEYSQLESNQVNLMANDSLVEKYAAARAQVEKLLNELQNEKNKSAAQISKLKAEIETLKGILRDYTARINELMAENEGLRDENATVKDQNRQLNQRVEQVTRANEQLSERMTLAEKLNVTGLNIVALNRKGKNEKHITKAQRLMVTFTITQNNSTPAGEKMIYLRITNPEGDLLGDAGHFDFEGTSLQATARKSIEYANEEIGGVTIYWDVDATLNAGVYTVELFCDNYKLDSRKFTMNK